MLVASELLEEVLLTKVPSERLCCCGIDVAQLKVGLAREALRGVGELWADVVELKVVYAAVDDFPFVLDET